MNWRNRAPLVLLALSQIADVATTIWGVSVGHLEGNQLVHGDLAVLFISKAILLLGIVLVWLYAESKDITIRIPYYMAAGAVFYVAICNVLTIAGLPH